ncbi:adenosylmethionine decarboxylase [Algivirga pacifica]|uniref:S-adenosylmethionine decarboxylase proenzyme n=1 Tax=Algivirga pacifica TaxID=1162670 RepID=A0ABP9DB27_9BACT
MLQAFEGALGRQLTGEVKECNPEILNNVIAVEQAMVKAAQEANATVINSTFHHFSPYGVSGVVVIQESHLAVHTWPEYGFATIDFFTCGEHVYPQRALNYLAKAFEGKHIDISDTLRGDTNALQEQALSDSFPYTGQASLLERSVWVTEVGDALMKSYKAEVASGKQLSPYWQKLHTPSGNELLTFRGKVVLDYYSSKVMHEMMVHPIITNTQKAEVLVCGLEGAGLLKELGSYEGIKPSWWVEKEEKLLSESFYDITSQKNEIKVLVGEELKGVYDIILLDEHTLGKDTFDITFYNKHLKRNGTLVLVLGQVELQSAKAIKHLKMLQQQFAMEDIKVYWAHTGDVGGSKLFAWVSKEPSSRQWLNEESKEGTEDFFYYDEEIRKTCFTLPKFIRKQIERL